MLVVDATSTFVEEEGIMPRPMQRTMPAIPAEIETELVRRLPRGLTVEEFMLRIVMKYLEVERVGYSGNVMEEGPVEG